MWNLGFEQVISAWFGHVASSLFADRRIFVSHPLFGMMMPNFLEKGALKPPGRTENVGKIDPFMVKFENVLFTYNNAQR